ncbi:probable mitochondrial glutathione transporter SLC25A39 isoform X2 [Paramacrobiotus metropolitanus]|uniref:probable mitochondrial glutathione transporter SLC25A39 isoform X2 n=1 Tax=Paramacrobiotus metropolitanus TaxID=2943436 RepID=UPI0024456037|nr:probable mitochondrial glutathione transporter SLC25A39 isoform X2 [Paramacrobiotus metropolitanus]
MATNGITSTQQIIASSTGAMLTSLFTTPLDVVKVRLQSQSAVAAYPGEEPFSARNHGRIATPRFTGTIDTLVKVARQEGVLTLWAGLPPTLVMTVPATVLYFTTYEKLKEQLSKSRYTDYGLVPIFAGALARICAVTVISPIELIRTKLQSEKLDYYYIWRAVKATVKKEGILSLWRGWGPTILRDVPFSCIYWFHYETFKKMVLKRKQSSELPVIWAFASGAAAGTIAGVTTLPFDVVKTHRQIELGELLSVRPTVRKQPTTTLALMVNLYKQRGIKALFSGVAPRVAKVAPSCAIMISSYEFFKNYFRKKNQGMANDVPSHHNVLMLQKPIISSANKLDESDDKRGKH